MSALRKTSRLSVVVDRHDGCMQTPEKMKQVVQAEDDFQTDFLVLFESVWPL